jgi:hypothetical protein
MQIVECTQTYLGTHRIARGTKAEVPRAQPVGDVVRLRITEPQTNGELHLDEVLDIPMSDYQQFWRCSTSTPPPPINRHGGSMGNTTDIKPTPQAQAQIHSKFKVFIPPPGIAHADALRQFNDVITEFTKGGKVAPKSVGVEYLEDQRQLVLSLGYRDDEPGYPVTFTSVSLGHPRLSADAIESAMQRAAADVPNVICHEFFMTENGEFVLILMSHG